MAEPVAAAAAVQRAIMERVRRFHFDRYDSNIEEWPYYIRRFETELALYELRGDDTMQQRRNLLLSRIGPDAYKIVVDHFRPEEVETRDYDEVKQVLHRYYAKNICITAERVVFSQRHRKDSETVTQFINALRALAGHCEFGASLDERLRDQLIIGVANDTWQKEIFRLHPTNASTLAQVEATVLVLEQASQQQQRLHGLAKSNCRSRYYNTSCHAACWRPYCFRFRFGSQTTTTAAANTTARQTLFKMRKQHAFSWRKVSS